MEKSQDDQTQLEWLTWIGGTFPLTMSNCIDLGSDSGTLMLGNTNSLRASALGRGQCRTTAPQGMYWEHCLRKAGRFLALPSALEEEAH